MRLGVGLEESHSGPSSSRVTSPASRSRTSPGNEGERRYTKLSLTEKMRMQINSIVTGKKDSADVEVATDKIKP